MKHILFASAVTLALHVPVAFAISDHGRAGSETSVKDAAPVMLVIHREKGAEPILKDFGVEADFVHPTYERVTLPKDEADDLSPQLRLHIRAKQVERSGRISGQAVTPNDPGFENQVAWQPRTEQLAGASSILLGYQAAMQVKKLTVAIIDHGFDAHSDMTWAGGINLYGGDQNEYLDYLTCDNSGPQGYHGQEVGSIIGAAANNGIGIAGILDADMFAVKVADCATGSGFGTTSAEGVRWAAGDPNTPAEFVIPRPANIINVSRGGYSSFGCPTYWQDAIDFARDQGAIVVVSAGNEGGDISADNNTPGNCDGVLTIANVDVNGFPETNSSRGSVVDYSAHGVNVPVSAPFGGVGSATGTSFSAPHVAGIVGLAWQAVPELSSTEVLELVSRSVTPLPGNPTGMGSGVPNAELILEEGVNLLLENPIRVDHPERNGSVTPGLAAYLADGSCDLVEVDASETNVDGELQSFQLTGNENVVLFRVSSGADLATESNRETVVSRTEERFLTPFAPAPAYDYGVGICTGSDATGCNESSIQPIDVSRIGAGTGCAA